jgi:hypothetical protein
MAIELWSKDSHVAIEYITVNNYFDWLTDWGPDWLFDGVIDVFFSMARQPYMGLGLLV